MASQLERGSDVVMKAIVCGKLNGWSRGGLDCSFGGQLMQKYYDVQYVHSYLLVSCSARSI